MDESQPMNSCTCYPQLSCLLTNGCSGQHCLRVVKVDNLIESHSVRLREIVAQSWALRIGFRLVVLVNASRIPAFWSRAKRRWQGRCG